MREVIQAQYAGFCKGVGRAVGLARARAAAHGCCYTLGPIIHNQGVVTELEAHGVHCVTDLSQVPGGSTVVIRSHGVTPEVYREIEALGLICCDATCPDVKKIHKIVSEESVTGRQVILLGDSGHPEVTGVAGWCRNPLIVEDLAALEALFDQGPLSPKTPISFVAQTTCPQTQYEPCVNFLKKVCTNAKIFDTICNATLLRQQEAKSLAAHCDVMVVVGDAQSANTRHLVDICQEACSQVFLIENARQADKLSLQLPSDICVGLTAGASAPARVIKEVKQEMSDEKNVPEEIELSFEEMLDQSFKTLTTGDKVTGIITGIGSTELNVDLGTKHAGYIPISELSDDLDYKVEDHLHVGDTIETFVMRVNDVEGTALLSKKRVDAVQTWDDIEVAKSAHNIVEGIVSEENKGGLVVSVRGIRVFVPASQSGVPKDGNLSAMLKKRVKLYVTEVNKARRRVVGSIRAAQNDDRKLKADAVWTSIAEGSRYKGTVKSLTSYGAFVDIGGVDGMVHVSELSWSRVSHPSEVLKVGDEIEVYVLSFDTEKHKISLGYKDKSQNPWNQFVETYKAGDIVNVKVVKLAPFGAFCEIIPGVDGLVHISHISEGRIGKPGDVLKEGQRVDVKILEINHENKKVSLSIRDLSPYEEAPDTSFPEMEAAPQAADAAEEAVTAVETAEEAVETPETV